MSPAPLSFAPVLSNRRAPALRRAALGLGAVLAAASLGAQSAFLPNDPYFFPASGPAAPGAPAPGYYGQWNLVNQMPVSAVNAGLDANIAAAWARGLTGAGVVIAIVDQGVEMTHPDLAANFANEFSYSFPLSPEENGAEGFLRGGPIRDGLSLAGDSHGTAVAGIAAAAGGNGIGLTGAAPNARLAALQINGPLPAGVTQAQMRAASILFQGQTDANGNPNPYVPYAPAAGEAPPVRVMNHSYGTVTGYASDGEGVMAALHTSAGQGVIHVFAAGNQRFGGANPRATADSNKSQRQSSPDIINVAALGSDGRYSGRSSFGANVFVTAPSDGLAGAGLYSVATTDRTTASNGYNADPDRPDPYFNFSSPGPNDGASYTSTFGGTSSAAPLVSGVMALGVEANPALNVRMAQHLLARTSRVVDAADAVSPTNTGGWVTNAAGHHFNNNYGFGLIDADAFTRAATQFSGVTDAVVHQTGDIAVGLGFAEGLSSITRTARIAAAGALPLEFVQVRFRLAGLEADWEYYAGTAEQPGIGAIAGDFEAWLVSPGGTRNRLFLDDRGIPPDLAESRRNHAGDTLDWTFTSYAYWGEDLNGDWTIELTNHSPNTTDLGTWENFAMTFGLGELVPVPEPGTLALTALGLGAVLTMRHRGRGSSVRR